jgi:hypothetical protein
VGYVYDVGEEVSWFVREKKGIGGGANLFRCLKTEKEFVVEWECGKVCESRVKFFCQDDTNTDDCFNRSLLSQEIRQVPTRRIVERRGFSLVVLDAITCVVWKTRQNLTRVSGYNLHVLYTTGHANYMRHPCYICVVSYCALYPGCRHEWSVWYIRLSDKVI